MQQIYDAVSLDENAEPADLLQQADAFEALRKRIERDSTTFEGHSLDVECRQEAKRAFELLSDFFLQKSRAARYRLKGEAESASQYETAAERSYNQLPKGWKW